MELVAAHVVNLSGIFEFKGVNLVSSRSGAGVESCYELLHGMT